MRKLLRSIAILAIALLSGAFALLTAGSATAGGPPAKALLFVQTDASNGNAVVVYQREGNGSLKEAGVYPTGGLGATLDGAVVDRQASQGSLLYDRKHNAVLALNAGSDTVTVFRVEGKTLKATQTIASGGSFPASITIHNDVVFVLNVRGGASIQGFTLKDGTLTTVPGWHRELKLPTGTPEFTHTPGQVGFTPNGKRLVVTTKAADNSLLVWGFRHGKDLSQYPVRNADPGAVPFGFTFDPHGHLVVVEAATSSVANFDLASNGIATLLHRAPAVGQAAACWIAASGKLVFTSNAGSATVSSFYLKQDRPVLLAHAPTNPGTIDGVVSPDGKYLYVQTGAQGTVDSFSIGKDGRLTPAGSVTVPNAVGGEGIAVS
jgi:6-phosphogluconolactonase (cycloisomerase 2 family)